MLYSVLRHTNESGLLFGPNESISAVHDVIPYEVSAGRELRADRATNDRVQVDVRSVEHPTSDDSCPGCSANVVALNGLITLVKDLDGAVEDGIEREVHCVVLDIHGPEDRAVENVQCYRAADVKSARQTTLETTGFEGQ